MGIWYYAVLLYGIEIPEKEISELSEKEEEEHYDDSDYYLFWDDPESGWDDKHENHPICIESIPYSYDGDRHVYIYPRELYYKTEMYDGGPISLPESIDKESVNMMIEKVTKELGVSYTDPGWHLMTMGY